MLYTKFGKRIEYHPSEINMNCKRLLEKGIGDYYADKNSGAYVRSRSKWREKGEKKLVQLLGLEKKQQTYKTISKIKDEPEKNIQEHPIYWTLL